MEKKYCEHCRFYNHKPNILGGTAECLLGIKNLSTLQMNEACGFYQETKRDNLKAQDNFYEKNLNGVLKLATDKNLEISGV